MASPSAVSLGSLRLPEAAPASRSVTKVLTALLTAGEPVDAACVSSAGDDGGRFFQRAGSGVNIASRLAKVE